ncbi:MAG: hypothetical protein AAFV19_09165 [Pseudomonadota bacterium]
MKCKSKVKEGSGVPGFGVEAIMFDGACHGTLSGSALSLDESALAKANGTFICNKDDKVTMGVAVAGGFLVSDQFGGCDLTIVKNPAGAVLGAHVYSSEKCRSCIAALPTGWSTVGTWKSSGYKAKWPNIGGLLAFAFIEGSKVKVVAAGIAGYPGKISNVELAHTFDL